MAFRINITAKKRTFQHIFSLYLNAHYSDFRFCIDHEYIPGHKAIVSNKSPYFDALIRNSDGNTVRVLGASRATFLEILRFIYTGKFVMSALDLDEFFTVMGLAHQYLLMDLAVLISKNLYNSINFETVYRIINVAILYRMEDLTRRCCSFLDNNAWLVLSNLNYMALTQEAMVAIIDRDSFVIPEICILEMVIQWRTKNFDSEDKVLRCVRFTNLTIPDMVETVLPLNCLPHLDIIRYIYDITRQKGTITRRKSKYQILANVDLTGPTYNAKFRSGTNENTAVGDFCNMCSLSDNGEMVVELGTLYLINNIMFNLVGMWELDGLGYTSYSIDVSIDSTNWKPVCDYSRYLCRDKQNIYFAATPVKFIRWNASKTNSIDQHLSIEKIRVFYKTELYQKYLNGIPVPHLNSALSSLCKHMVQGALHKNTLTPSPYTADNIIAQLNQPHLLQTMSFLLEPWAKFMIDTSVDNVHWEKALDYKHGLVNENDYFGEFPIRIVTLIRISLLQKPTELVQFKNFCVS